MYSCRHYEIWKYCQSTSKVEAYVLQNLRVCRGSCIPPPPPPPQHPPLPAPFPAGCHIFVTSDVLVSWALT